MTDQFCPRCGAVLNVSRDNAVDLFDCVRCGFTDVKAASGGYVRPAGPPGGDVETIRFGSNYGDARRKP